MIKGREFYEELARKKMGKGIEKTIQIKVERFIDNGKLNRRLNENIAHALIIHFLDNLHDCLVIVNEETYQLVSKYRLLSSDDAAEEIINICEGLTSKSLKPILIATDELSVEDNIVIHVVVDGKDLLLLNVKRILAERNGEV